MKKMQKIYENYQKDKLKKELNYSVQSEIDYLNAAIDFFTIFPEDFSKEYNILIFRENELDYLKQRRKALLSANSFNQDFFDKTAFLRKNFPMSFVKHSLYCDYKIGAVFLSDEEKEVFKLLHYKGRHDTFNKFYVSMILYSENIKNNLGLNGDFWDLPQEIFNYELQNNEGYFHDFVRIL